MLKLSLLHDVLNNPSLSQFRWHVILWTYSPLTVNHAKCNVEEIQRERRRGQLLGIKDEHKTSDTEEHKADTLVASFSHKKC